jgi:hypothetical protein
MEKEVLVAAMHVFVCQDGIRLHAVTACRCNQLRPSDFIVSHIDFMKVKYQPSDLKSMVQICYCVKLTYIYTRES